MTVFGTDEYQKGADGSYKFFNDYTSQLTGDVDFIQQHLERISTRASTPRTRSSTAAKTANVPAATRRRSASARRSSCARMYYFTLVRTYGDVPLHARRRRLAFRRSTTREPVAKVYDAIIADLIVAEAVLAGQGRRSTAARQAGGAAPPRRGLPDPRRRCGDLAPTSRLAEAKAVDRDNPALRAPAALQGRLDFGNEVNSEVIWAIQYTADPLTNGDEAPATSCTCTSASRTISSRA